MALKTFQSTISMICGGNFAQIVHHWQTDDTTAQSSFTLAKELRDALVSPAAGTSVIELLAACLAEDCYISSTRVRRIDVAGAPVAIKLYPIADFPGTFSGNMDAAQVAGCVIWLTAGNAGLNGRTFLPGVSEEAYQNGRPDPDYKDAISNLVQQMLDDVEGPVQTYNLVLRHGVGAATFTEIVHAYLSPDAGTQRRRLGRY